MTVAVAHREADRVIIDLVRERRPPFSPTDVCLEVSAALKSYGIGSVQSDKYAGSWVVESFAACGIRCEQSARPKSSLYTNLLPLLNSNRIELLDHPRLVAQLCGLERRTARGRCCPDRRAPSCVPARRAGPRDADDRAARCGLLFRSGKRFVYRLDFGLGAPLVTDALHSKALHDP